jgi:hypothetical protein
MHDETSFQSTYVALIALAWQALERIDGLLDSQHDVAVMAVQQERLQLLRLELLQLADGSRRHAGSTLVSTSQNVLVQRLVAKLLVWLDFDADTTMQVARMRIRAAQNWLFDEARHVARSDCERAAENVNRIGTR